jgi:hypothetical protein
MDATRKILTAAVGLLGAALVVRGLWGGAWPPAVQLVVGVLLLVYAYVRWRTL